jgi:ribosomal protein L24
MTDKVKIWQNGENIAVEWVNVRGEKSYMEFAAKSRIIHTENAVIVANLAITNTGLTFPVPKTKIKNAYDDGEKMYIQTPHGTHIYDMRRGKKIKFVSNEGHEFYA